MINNEVNKLRQRILPILLFCQANKGDLWLYEQWRDQEGAAQKFFYAYYAGLFCRILCLLETGAVTDSLVSDTNALLDKYNWYDIQEKDLELCVSTGIYSGEVPEALQFIEGVDNVAWKDSGFGNVRDAVCLKVEHGSWTFADVRGNIGSSIR